MQFITCHSHQSNAQLAVIELVEKLSDSNPQFIICYYTEDYDLAMLSSELRHAFPHSVIHGCSSYCGVMTEKGYHQGPVVALFAIYDNTALSAYGSALNHFESDSELRTANVRKITESTLNSAIESADRVGELPGLVILHSTIGYEEAIVAQIEEQLGGHVELIGGSAADNKVNKKWSLISGSVYSHSGVSISVLYPSKPTHTAFSGGHYATSYCGEVTRAQGRQLIEIDGKNAAEVYQNWISRHLAQSSEEGLGSNFSAMYPLGRSAGEVFDTPYFKLSHPLKLDRSGITLFTNIEVGEKVFLMTGGKEQLINRASQVTLSAINSHPTEISLIGGVNIFCAGSMSIIYEQINDVYHSMNKVYGAHPFICPFTYGEQGSFVNGENAHGNLMLSSVIFYSDTNPYE